MTSGRAVVFDEFPGNAFEQEFVDPVSAVSEYLEYADLPFEDYTDLLESRTNPERRWDSLLTLQTKGSLDSDLEFALNSGYHTLTPAVVYVLLTADETGRATFPESNYVGYHDRESGAIWLLMPPNLEYASSVLGLDATPTKRMWELSLGVDFDVDRVLSDREQIEFFDQVRNQRFVHVRGGQKPYSSGEWVSEREDYAVAAQIAENHGRQPPQITTRAAKDEYEDITEVVQPTEIHYGNVNSSNALADETLGLVTGSPHYGDGFIRKWCAYAGEEFNDPGSGQARARGAEQTYGEFGDTVFEYMAADQVFQAAMRFGRNTEESFIYVYTNAFPDRVPISATVDGISLTKGQAQLWQILVDANWLTTAEIVEQAHLKERRVQQLLKEWQEKGRVEERKFPNDRRKVQWRAAKT